MLKFKVGVLKFFYNLDILWKYVDFYNFNCNDIECMKYNFFMWNLMFLFMLCDLNICDRKIVLKCNDVYGCL